MLGGLLGGVAGPAAGALGGGPAVSGLTDQSASSSGSNFVNVGNPLQNAGAILKELNAGSAVNGGFPTLPQSDVTRINNGSPMLAGSLGVAGSQAGISLGGMAGIALIGGAILYYFRKR